VSYEFQRQRPVRIGEILRMMGFEPDVAANAAARGQDAKRAYADYLRDNQTDSERMMGRALYHLECDVEPQQVVMGWIVDFLDRENKVVIEVDGTSHDGKTDYDNDRDQAMRAAGYRVIRIDYWEVPHILQQVARMRAEARA
jgi:very-short-patch-repair endonuclease